MKKNQIKFTFLIIITVFICTTIIVLNLNNETTEKKFTHDNIELNIPQNDHHTVPYIDPFYGVGTEYLIGGGTAYSLFDNTTIYSDTNNDGIYDHSYELDASEYIDPNSPYPGSRIYSDKPIVYEKRLCKTGTTNAEVYYLSSVPPINVLKNEYYIPQGTWYFASQQPQTIFIDENFNDLIDSQINIDINGGTFLVNNYSRVFSDKVFYCYNKNSFIGPPGTDFYNINEDVEMILIIEDNTDINIDLNNDGNFDESLNLDVGEYGPYTWTSGCHINSTKPILIFNDINWYGNCQQTGIYIPPSHMMGSDKYLHVFLGSLSRYRTHIGSFSNNTLYAEGVTNNLGIPEWNQSLGANEKIDIEWSPQTIHIWGTKPFEGYFGDYWNAPSYHYTDTYRYYYPFPSSYISSINLHFPEEIELDTFIEMKIRVFNPLAITELNNIGLTIRIDDNFTIPSGDIIDINIEKRYLKNDTLIYNDLFQKSVTNQDNLKIIQILPVDSDILLSLDSLQYYEITYQILSPSTPELYNFPPVTIGYSTSTWVLS